MPLDHKGSTKVILHTAFVPAGQPTTQPNAFWQQFNGIAFCGNLIQPTLTSQITYSDQTEEIKSAPGIVKRVKII